MIPLCLHRYPSWLNTGVRLYSSNVLENVRLLTESLRGDRQRRTASESSLALAEQVRYGYAFSQDEEGIAQTELIRRLDSTIAKPLGR
ncbi:unnamed protein product [Caenorhabditis auriculariae]|uniref:Uncharacterized protein n=1 Tax=Caenorhabditis auriculariae TaxID=2777116 RepID=A0A8S1GQW3_9PELO|nr:unnamed protein product [Caenorhabditis auriculariae]